MKRVHVLAGAALAVASSLCAFAGCDGTENVNEGLEEPIRVRSATFRHGALPGSPPRVADAGTGTPAPEPAPTMDGGVPDAAPPDGLRVTSIDALNSIIYPGESGKKLAGQATGNTAAVGVRFPDMGTGYWSFQVDVPDPQAPGQVTWDALCDFGRDLTPGIHQLRFVSFDANGAPGEQKDLKVCIPSLTNKLHPCSPKAAVPAAMIELVWDRNVDLDLRVTTPSGKVIGPKRPSTAKPDEDGGVTVDPKKDGVLDRDANGGCVIDAINREEIAWPEYPERGTYRIRVNLFDACGQPNARFTVAAYVAAGEGETRELVEKVRRAGLVTELDVDADGQTGLFVTDFLYLSHSEHKEPSPEGPAR